MYRYLIQRSSSQVARQCSHAARSLTSLSTTSQKWSVERSGLCCFTAIKRSFATNDDFQSPLKNDLKRTINSRSSPIQEHERWKALSLEEQQFIAPDLLDAWIRYHADLSASYYEDETNNDSKLSAMIDSAHRAHSVLDRLYPQWSPRRFGQSSEEQNNPAAVARANQILALWASTTQAGHRRSFLRKELRGIPQRAQFLCQQLPPSTESSNALLRIWAYSHEHWRGTRAQSIFNNIVNPNAESYRLMIRAWAWSGERRGAFTATGFLRRMLRLLDEGNRDMEPSIDEYRIVLDSWTRAKDQHAPEKAMSVTNLLDHALDRGTTFVQFDSNCYRSILVTAARRPELTDLGKTLVDRVLKRMGEWFLVPDTICYEAAIRTWKHEALNAKHDRMFQTQAVNRVLELLGEMDVAHNQSSTVLVRPTTSIYNDVLEALTIEGQRWEEAEKLLLKMEQSSSADKPNAATYRLVLRLLKNRTTDDKLNRARDILDRFYRNMDEQNCSHSRRDQVAVLNEFIEVCASANVQSDAEGMKILGQVLDAVQAARCSHATTPDSSSFASLLKACQSLILSLPTRQKFAERVFDLCRDAGMVNKSVLLEFKKSVPSDRFIDVVISSCRNLEGNKAIPADWNRNAFGGKVCSADGSRSLPLGADGEIIITKEVSDFRLRRLIDKRNRNSIRGGRLPKPPKFGTLKAL